MWFRHTRFAAGAAVVSLLVACGSNQVSAPPRTNLIAFTRVVVAPTGANPFGQSSVVAAPVSGGAAITLIANASYPSWSPNGTQLVFKDDPTSALYIANADGSGRRKLVDREEGHLDGADWSPDGKTLVFTGDDQVNCCPSDAIYVIELDGSIVRRLTTQVAAYSSPRWSPDGRWVAFLRSEDVSMTRTEFDLCLVRADEKFGSSERCLTHTREDEGPASWSPDGTRLVYGKARAAKTRPGNYRQVNEDIVVFSLTTGRAKMLMRAPFWDSLPAWSPDGRTIAFTRRVSESGPGRTYLVDADGRHVRPLRVRPQGDDSGPVWQRPSR